MQNDPTQYIHHPPIKFDQLMHLCDEIDRIRSLQSHRERELMFSPVDCSYEYSTTIKTGETFFCVRRNGIYEYEAEIEAKARKEAEMAAEEHARAERQKFNDVEIDDFVKKQYGAHVLTFMQYLYTLGDEVAEMPSFPPEHELSDENFTALQQRIMEVQQQRQDKKLDFIRQCYGS